MPQSSALKAVIFDYGEVLCHRPTGSEIKRLANFFGVEVDQFPKLWERNRGPFDRGDLSAETYWSMLARDAEVTIPQNKLEEIYQLDLGMWSNINFSMVEWARRLRSSGMKIGLLSNMHPDMVTHARKNFAWLGLFDCLIFSGEVRLIKPDSAIYQRMLDCLGVKPSEVLFLDDREPNIRAARALGINAIRFRSMPQLQDELRAAGFPILPEN
jgi:putative hydrolase of the HAD superfamily